MEIEMVAAIIMVANFPVIEVELLLSSDTEGLSLELPMLLSGFGGDGDGDSVLIGGVSDGVQMSAGNGVLSCSGIGANASVHAGVPIGAIAGPSVLTGSNS
ncbi:hypothetical protein [Denitratimonas sp. CY0512]|uniref:hypothetical protein n=1 Tax=Denitratimonas sp. CY0512 TaxID=3131940 RepID=UPI0030A4819C